MKTLSLLLLSVFIFVHSHAQVPGENPGVKSVSKLQTLPNGKNIFSKAVSYSTNAKWMINGKEAESSVTKAVKPISLNGTTVQTHHIIFHFDRFTDVVWLNGADTLFEDLWNMNWTSNNILEGDLVDGYYELVVAMPLSLTYLSQYFCITKKDFHVYRNMDTTILSTSANHTINLILNDENGNPINYFPTMTRSGDGFGLAFEFPEGFKAPNLSICSSGFAPPVFFFTDVEPELKVHLGRMDATKTEPYHYYVVSYPVLQGIHSDTTMEDAPADLKHFPFIFHGTPGGTNFYLGWGFGTVVNDSILGGYADPFVASMSTNDYPCRATDTVQFYTTNVGIDTNKIFFGAGADHMERNPQDLMLADFMTPILFLDTQNDLILSTEGNFPPVPSDYKVADGNTVNFGTTAPFSISWGFNSGNDYQIWERSHFRGQTNERRYIDVAMGTYEIWKGNVPLMYDSIRTFDIKFNVWELGLYSVILNDSNYTLLGRNGFSQTNLTFDLTKEDANSPTLLAFKIRKADSISTELIHGYDASVEFTAADFTYPLPGIRLYHTIEEVHLYYKEYSGSTWYEVPVTPQTNLLDSISGMPYFADLGPMMNQFPDSAWIDLKVVLIDSTGNSNTQIMHPACLIRDALVGIASVSPEGSFKVYPNPATDRLNIVTDSEHFTVSLYTVTGQLVMEGAGCRSIDVSGFANGVYLVRFTDTKNGQSFTSKFVK